MPEQPTQNFENHVRTPTIAFAIMALYLLGIILAVVGIFTSATVIAVAVVLVAVGGVLNTINSRIYATTLQDRIIKTEMHIRLREVLPDDLVADIMDFTLPQLIGLRFASDEELPDLARKVLDENLRTAGEIKKLVTNWQADHQRV